MTFYLDLRSRLLDLDDVESVHAIFLSADPDLPAVVLQRIDRVRQGTHDQGAATATEQRWQADIYADSKQTLETVTEAVIASLDGWTDKTAGLDRTFVVDARDDYEPNAQRLRASIDLQAWIRRTNDG